MKELSVEVNGNQKELIIREGAAPIQHELRTLVIGGSINAPGDFLDVRKEQFPIDGTHVLINRDSGTIQLNAQDREDVGKILIKGSLDEHPDFTRSGVNDPDKVRSLNELAGWIKMNRKFFESKVVAMNLVSQLRNFKATVNKILEEKSDDRANYSTLKEQVVNSNIPETFTLTLPLFVGFKQVKFDVEVVIDPDDFSCALISPDAADEMRKLKEVTLDEQIVRFDGYAVIYQ